MSYGINHYRFHTCCPPEAAFIAADILGIYMEPQLPFWGTVTTEEDENHNAIEQEFLINEGFEMIKAFGNHPSFCMMSMGKRALGQQGAHKFHYGRLQESRRPTPLHSGLK